MLIELAIQRSSLFYNSMIAIVGEVLLSVAIKRSSEIGDIENERGGQNKAKSGISGFNDIIHNNSDSTTRTQS